MAEAIDFNKHWKSRESRKLAKQVAELADAPLCWRIRQEAKSFLRETRLGAADLTQIVRTATAVTPIQGKKVFAIEGSTVDEARALIYVSINSSDTPPSMTCLGGRLFPDEEDLLA